MSDMKANLSDEFLHVHKLLSQYQTLQHSIFGPSGDPHRGQGRVLSILKLKPEISQKELSYLLDIRNQSLGELLSKLEKNGLISRMPSDEDKRSMNIRLTEKGAKLTEQIEKKQDDFSQIFNSLSAEDQFKLHEILNQLTHELEEQLGNDKDMGKEKAKSGNHHHKNEGSSHQREYHNYNLNKADT